MRDASPWPPGAKKTPSNRTPPHIDTVRNTASTCAMELQATDVTFHHLSIGDAGWLIQRHAELYAERDGFDASFESLVAEILTQFIREHDPQTERAFIAKADGLRLGSIFCVQSGTPGVAKLRLFLLEPKVRGLGLGQRLLDACVGFARDAGYHRMRLWTHKSHQAACALYAKNGFRMVEEHPVHSFGVDLVEQSWEIDLS
ncbi:MAG: GNAT family N-acetyltransferase [Pseudomonadota bacterium]